LGDSLATFDCVIANPPFSLEKWGDDVWINDPYGRNFAGLPPAKSGDFAWVQHMIKSMARKTGRMAVVLPHGVLFRMSKEGEIRRKLLEMDILEAVIGLGQNIFYGTGLAPCVLVFRDSKPKAHRQKVLFIDASKEFKTGRAQNELLPEHVDNIHRWYEGYQDVEGICRVVTLDEIRENDFNLNIPRYVEPVIEEESMTIDQAIANLKESLQAAYAAEDRLKGCCSGRVCCEDESDFPIPTRILPLGRGHLAARLHRRRGLQAVHLPAAVLQAPVRRV
jgi:type I restriction enzyme M protein